MADIQLYNHNDIQRYLQHKMTPQEMHDFEKALMNDPFLADAVEGFSAGDVEVTGKHLTEIENELTGEIQAGKVVRMPLQKTAWWKIAAAILVVAAGGVLTYSSLKRTDDKKKVAQQMALPKPDSTQLMEKPLAKVEILPEKDLFDKQKNAAPIVRKQKQASAAVRKTTSKDAHTINKSEESIALRDKNTSSATTFKAPVIEPDKPAAKAKQTAAALVQQRNEVKNKVIDKKDKPDETVSVYGYNNNRLTSPDEYFASKATDSVFRLHAATTGYHSKDVTVKSDTPNNIIVNKANPSLSDMVVTSMIEKNKESDIKHLQQKTANDAEPIGGWQNFEQYLNRQTDSIKANDYDNHYSKNVEIEFSINNDGQPTNIKAIEKTESIVAEKAVQILTNGPKWKSKEKDKKVKIIIPFK